MAEPKTLPNYYERLGLLPTATRDEIQTAYATLRSEWDERVKQGDASAPEHLRLLDEAYATLGEPSRRAAYDRSMRGPQAGSALAVQVQPQHVVVPEEPPVPMLQRACPHCGALNPVQLTRCRECGKQVTRPCPQCGRPVQLGQTICPRCSAAIVEYDERRFGEATKVHQEVDDARREGASRVRRLEARHAVGRRQAVIFWGAVLVACMALSAIAFVVAYMVESLFGR